MNETNPMRASQRTSLWIGAGGAACLTVLIAGALVAGDRPGEQPSEPRTSHPGTPGTGPASSPLAAMGSPSGSPDPGDPQQPADASPKPADPKPAPPDMIPHDGYLFGPGGGCPTCGLGYVDARQRTFLDHLTQLG